MQLIFFQFIVMLSGYSAWGLCESHSVYVSVPGQEPVVQWFSLAGSCLSYFVRKLFLIKQAGFFLFVCIVSHFSCRGGGLYYRLYGLGFSHC